MKTINRVMLSGNLGRDPEPRYLQDGTLVLTLSLAVHTRKRQGDGYTEETDWYNVSVWGAQAQWLAENVRSGHAIIVDGRLKQSKWQDQATGQNRSRVEVIANDVYLLPDRETGSEGDGDGGTETHESTPDTGHDVVPAAREETAPANVSSFPTAPRRAQPPTGQPVSRPSIPRRPTAPPPEEDLPF